MKILNKIPRNVSVAFSGGVDSVAIVDFLTNKSAHNVNLLYYHHDTDHSEKAYKFVEEFSYKRSLNLEVGKTKSMFIIYATSTIINSQAVRNLIIREFSIPSQLAKFKTDPHYEHTIDIGDYNNDFDD